MISVRSPLAWQFKLSAQNLSVVNATKVDYELQAGIINAHFGNAKRHKQLTRNFLLKRC